MMSSLNWIYLCLFVKILIFDVNFVTSVESLEVILPELKVISPGNDSTYWIHPSFTSLPIPIQFRVNKELNSETKVCMTLFVNQTILFQKFCVKQIENELTLNYIPKGSYLLMFEFFNEEQERRTLLSSTIQPPEFSPITNVSFQVVEFNEILPRLMGPPHQEYLIDLQTLSSQIVFDYNLSDKSLEKYLDVCLELLPISPSTFSIPRACIPSDQNQVTLHDIPAGNYELSLELQYSSSPFTSFPESKTISTVKIHRPEDILPTLHLSHPNIEHGISSENKHLNDVSVGVSTSMNPLYSHTGLLSHIETCFHLHPAADNELPTLSHCVVAAPFLQFTLQRIPRGVHNFSLHFRSHSNPNVVFPLSRIEGRIIVEEMREFIPSYQWEELKPWHTIPSGVETRLPIGMFGRKEARIPEPWRLQAPMPHPCKYFLRMDVTRSTRIEQIRETIALRCKKPVSCFELMMNGKEIADYEENAESINLFGSLVDIVYLTSNEECQVLSEPINPNPNPNPIERESESESVQK